MALLASMCAFSSDSIRSRRCTLDAPRQERVVAGVGGLGQAVPVTGGRDDDFELPARVQDGLSEQLVGPVSQIAIGTFGPVPYGSELLASSARPGK